MGSAGPVSNIPLWKELLQLLDSTFQDILWVKVPSHVNVEGNEQADTLANNGRLNNPLYPARKTPRVQAAGQRAKRARQVAARSPPPRGVSPPRPIVLNFEQCIASPGPREETPDVPSDQGHESDVWLQLGLVEMPDSPRSEESTHSHLSSVPTVTNHLEGPGTPTTPFCDRITHTRGGRRSPSTSCSEHGSTETQTPPPAPDTAYNGDGNRSPSTSCSERGFS